MINFPCRLPAASPAHPVVPHYIRSYLQNILFIGILYRITVMNDIENSVFVSVIRNDAHMIMKDHNIPALPLFNFIHISSQGDAVWAKNTFRFFTRLKSILASGSSSG